MRKSIFLSVFWVATGILLGRVTGFLREISIASVFGVSEYADAAIIMLSAPDIILNLLVAGGLSAALIPEFKRLKDEHAWQLFLQVSWLGVLVFGLISLLLAFISGGVVKLLAPGLGVNAYSEAIRAMEVALWVLPLSVLAGVSSALLQARDKAVVPAYGTFIYNLAILYGILIYAADNKLMALAWFVIIGSGVRLMAQWVVLKKNFKFNFHYSQWLVNKEIAGKYFHGLLAVSALFLLPVICRSFSSLLGEGKLSIFNYAIKLVELPLGVIIGSMVMVVYPKLAQMHNENKMTEFDLYLKSSVFWSIVVSIMIAAVVLVLGQEVVELIYGLAGIEGKNLQLIETVLVLLILTLPLHAIIMLYMAAHNAQGRTRFVMKVNISGVLLMLLTGYIAVPVGGLEGIVLAYILTIVMVVVLMWFGMQIYAQSNLNLVGIIKITIPVGLIVYLVVSFIAMMALHAAIEIVLSAVVMIGAGLLVYRFAPEYSAIFTDRKMDV